jgi:hypothetical protein
METGFPEADTARLMLSVREPRDFTLALRRPYWTGEGFAVQVNGQPYAWISGFERNDSDPRERHQYDWPNRASAFVDITRTWRTGDTVEVTLPKSLRLEPLPDIPRRAAILWGPLVLAGDLGPERAREGVEGEAVEPPIATPVFVTDEDDVSSWVAQVADSPARFRSTGAGREPGVDGRPHDVDLVPFYRLHRRTYATYWDVFTSDEWQRQQELHAAAAERRRLLEAATVAYLEPGQAVSERAFDYRGAADAVAARLDGRRGRRGRTWFSYDVPVEPDHPMALILTYNSGDRRGTPALFDVMVDGTVLRREEIGLADPPRFFDVEYPIPAAVVSGKAHVALRFQAVAGSQIATIFGVRVVRTDEER